MAEEIKITNLIINKLTKAKYDELNSQGRIYDDELYSLTDLVDILDELLERESTGADTSLSNINTTGETKIKNLSKSVCAETSLSNINEAGIAKIKSLSEGMEILYDSTNETLIFNKPE